MPRFGANEVVNGDTTNSDRAIELGCPLFCGHFNVLVDEGCKKAEVRAER
jgi:hypothetical protein